MIILNTTFFIHPAVESEFAEWVMNTYIPLALSAGLSDPSMSLILTKVEEELTGFALQLHCDNLDSAEIWHDGEGAKARESFLGKYGERTLCFSTFMEPIPLR